MSKIEFVRIEEKVGFTPTENEDYKGTNPAVFKQFSFRNLPYLLPEKIFMEEMQFLTPYDLQGNCRFLVPTLGSCRIYNLRPMICRLWGTVNHPYMRCRFGCVPERWVTPAEARQYFQKVLDIQKEKE